MRGGYFYSLSKMGRIAVKHKDSGCFEAGQDGKCSWIDRPRPRRVFSARLRDTDFFLKELGVTEGISQGRKIIGPEKSDLESRQATGRQVRKLLQYTR